jgi:serine/threonine protein kinase
LLTLFSKIKEKKPQINPRLSFQAQDFLTKTLELAEKDRLSWEEVFSHPIFNNKFRQYLIDS